MSELEAILKNLMEQNPNVTQETVDGVIKEYDEQNKKLSFIPDTIVAETTRNTDSNIVIPEIIQGQDETSEDGSDPFEILEKEERKEARIQRDLSRMNLQVIPGQGVVDLNQGKEDLKEIIKNNPVGSTKHLEATKRLNEVRKQDYNNIVL